MPQSCSTLLGICQTEESRAGMPGFRELKANGRSPRVRSLWRGNMYLSIRAHAHDWCGGPRAKHLNNATLPLDSIPSRPHCVGRFEMPRDRIVDIHVRLCVLPPASALMQHNDNVNRGWHFEQCAHVWRNEVKTFWIMSPCKTRWTRVGKCLLASVKQNWWYLSAQEDVGREIRPRNT